MVKESWILAGIAGSQLQRAFALTLGENAGEQSSSLGALECLKLGHNLGLVTLSKFTLSLQSSSPEGCSNDNSQLCRGCESAD